ncbi:uncharacterized protein LOC142624352 [Castanea sativa]|uniref:uncharacterized protein LOC142624352 n=1 Tax=Castanea sativa TaxID=21020 RepID=UPI003F64B7F9
MSDLQAVQDILSLYEQALGQKLNREKTNIFFSKAVNEETKALISNFLQVSEVKEYGKYLGLLAGVGRNKKASLNFIKERVWSILQEWKEKLLSQVGREILLKVVMQAIPTFAMGQSWMVLRLLLSSIRLLTLGIRTWYQNFLVFEVDWIKAIPLCWTDQYDRIIWPDNPDGEYSIKAGYQKLCEEANVSNASSSDPSHQKSFWKKIWKLHVPNKIKNFLWRICSNALPTKENLKKRRIIEDARCSACLSEQESTFHSIWGCEKINHVWAPCFSWVRTEHSQIQDLQELINLLGQRVQRLELFGVVVWFIWNHRNRL